MGNEIIGFGGSFALTFFLLLLRHLYLSLGRSNKSRYVAPTALSATRELNKKAAGDDARFLWTADLDGQGGSPSSTDDGVTDLAKR
jgi:hypothetical protein